jgi:hypothetical protein
MVVLRGLSRKTDAFVRSAGWGSQQGVHMPDEITFQNGPVDSP